MSETRSETQFSVFLVNKPGALALVTQALAAAGVNVLAMTLVDSQEHGVLRVVPDDAATARAVLTKLNLPVTETEVLCLDLPHRPGALAGAAALLGENHININYAYCTGGAPGAPATGVFKVADAKKARRLLQEQAANPGDANDRRPAGRRST